MDLHALRGVPGAGKTNRILQESIRLIASGIKPERLGIVSFTKAAAVEIAERLAREFGGDESEFESVRTLHSFALAIFSAEHDRTWKKLSARKAAALFASLHIPYNMAELRQLDGWVDNDEERFAENHWSERSWAGFCLAFDEFYRSRLLPMRDERDLYRAVLAWEDAGQPFPWNHRSRAIETLELFLPAYNAYKSAEHIWDFNDLLVYALATAAPPLDALFVDEAQDLSPLQAALTFHWAGSIAGEVWFCGDPYQAIYTFQGADPSIMLSLPCEPTYLSSSWRIKHAMAIYAYNWLQRGGGVQSFAFSGRPDDEYLERFDTTAILLRTNNLVEKRAQALMDDGIPFRAIRGSIDPLHQPEARAVYAALQLGKNGAVSLAELNAILACIVSKHEAGALIKWGTKKVVHSLLERRGSASMLRLDELESLGFSPRLCQWLGDANPWPALEKLDGKTRTYYQRVARSYGSQALLEEHCKTLVSNIHAVKGKEFGTVYYSTNMAKRPYRSITGNDQAQIQEEHRISYVALTRAANRLVIERPGYGNTLALPSWGDESRWVS